MNKDHILEPIRFFADADLLSGARINRLPEGTQIIEDLDLAMTLENSQDLPEGYRIWSDAVTYSYPPEFYTETGRRVETLIENEADGVWQKHGALSREALKRRLQKEQTEAEEFWDTVAFDIMEQLKSISLNRYFQHAHRPFWEALFQVYRGGFYPCGIKTDGALVAFDPRRLEVIR